MSSSRAFAVTFGLTRDPPSEKQCKALWLLRSAMKLPIAPTSTSPSKPWLFLGDGCTCGQCSHGYLSPKMQWRLRTCAEVAYDETHPEQLGYDDMHLFVDMETFPESARPKTVDKPFFRGFAAMYEAIVNLLDRNEEVLPDAVLAEARKIDAANVNKFVDKGGHAKYVMRAVMANRLVHEEICGDDTDIPEIECTNDDDSALVLSRWKIYGVL